MQKKQLTIGNKLGLHARATMKLVDVACRYQAKVTLIYNDRAIDAKDILQALSLGAPLGSQISCEIDGPDEEESMAAIIRLINDKFGEE